MGSQLYARGVSYERCFDELNLTEPALVQRIHREYIRAGAELIETNTFGANRFKLAPYGLADRVRDINFRAVKLAREAREECGEPVFLAGAIGPLGRLADCVAYPKAERPRPNGPRYSDSGQPAEEAFDLKDPLRKGAEAGTGGSGAVPPAAPLPPASAGRREAETVPPPVPSR